MKTLRAGLALQRGCAHSTEAQWRSLQHRLQALRIAPRVTTRTQSTFPEAGDKEPEMGGSETGLIVHARPFPVSPSYFTRTLRFNDNFIKISTLFRTMQNLPLAPPEKLNEKTTWKTAREYRLATNEDVRALAYSQCLAMVKHLHNIHPDLQTKELVEALEPFKRVATPIVNDARPIPIDKFGRAVGVGRRKTSTARAWVVEGTGEVLVNGKSLSEAFGRVHDRESAVWALRASERLDKYNVWALVAGGGTTGQAEALTLAIANGLLAHEPALKPALRRAGCVTRDRRKVERKKPGHVKARKMPAWVKR